jgi:hypothetical protein
VFKATPGEWEQLIALAGLPSADLRGHGNPTDEVPLPPPRKMDVSAKPGGGTSPVDMAAISATNADTGRLGEEWVIEHEQKRLLAEGHPELAGRVEHVAVTQGDGLGYDVLSFETDGTPRRIEVKTTRNGASASFYASVNEVQKSRELAPEWMLYRVHDINDIPQLRISRKPLDQYDLQPTVYRVPIWTG